MSGVSTTKRPVACPPTPEQYAPTVRVQLHKNTAEGELIMIDVNSNAQENSTVAGIHHKRRKFAVGVHNQATNAIHQNDAAVAFCLDDGHSGQLVSCQRHGVINVLLDQKQKNVTFGQTLTVGQIHPAWRPSIVSKSSLATNVGEVVTVYHNNPEPGYTIARVKLNLT